MRVRVNKLAGAVSRYLHVPAGVAVIIAVILIPKVLAILMIVWYIAGTISARRLSQTRPDKGE